MEIAYNIAVWLHIAAGFLTLLLFWLQIFLAKGTRRHVLAGRSFFGLGTLVAVSALFSILYQVGKAALVGELRSADPQDFAFAALLAFISIEVLVMLTHGRSAAFMSRDPSRELGIGAKIRVASSFTAAIAFALFALRLETVFLVSFLGGAAFVAIGARDRFLIIRLASTFRRNDWVAEHFRGMIGAGIAFHAAFGVFGMFRLSEVFGLDPRIGIVIVALPIIVGIPTEVILRRKYRASAASS